MAGETDSSSGSPPSDWLRRFHLSCPITCLKLDSSKKFLFVCQGPGVSVFSRDPARSGTEKSLFTRDVLPARRIHGMKVKKRSDDDDDDDDDGGDVDRVIFFGQKQFRLGEFRRRKRRSAKEVEEKEEVELVLSGSVVDTPDWLWEVEFLRSSSSPHHHHHHHHRGHLAVVTAHNQLRCYDVDSGTTVRVAEAPERHILYSAAIIGDEWDSLVVAAGTVFNRVVLWAPGRSEVVTLAGMDYASSSTRAFMRSFMQYAFIHFITDSFSH